MLNRFSRRLFCTASPRPWLFVGLGNPGDKYKGTRHNVRYNLYICENSQINVLVIVNFKIPFCLAQCRWGLRWSMPLLNHKGFQWTQFIAKLSLDKVCQLHSTHALHKYSSTLLHLSLNFVYLCLRFCWWCSCFPCKASDLHEFEWWISKLPKHFLIISGVLISKVLITFLPGKFLLLSMVILSGCMIQFDYHSTVLKWREIYSHNWDLLFHYLSIPLSATRARYIIAN